MKIERIFITNFRRLEAASIPIEDKETIFVGPNNSGKTSATAIFRCFLGDRPFRFHDFSVSSLTTFDEFGRTGNDIFLPEITLDIWMTIDPNSIEFGRTFSLLPNLGEDFTKLGVRLSYKASDPTNLRESYLMAYPQGNNQAPAKSLSQYLSQEGVFARHFATTYASLEENEGAIVATPLDQRDGKALLKSLVRIDFVDAQRNIDDIEGSRSNRLSSAFASFYQKNLEQATIAAEAHQVIDENNERLSAHYQDQFAGLMGIIKGLGVPSINDRDLKIVSTLSPETALKGSTDLLYVDNIRGHELPELYNGLGFKNLIFMAIQARNFHSQWARTEQDRPLCQLIFIEEPEVHLHAQVQQTFIRNIWEVINSSARNEGEATLVPQLVVTTHSSHILDAAEFGKVRYFRRCPLSSEDPATTTILNATQVHSLRDFQPEAVAIDGQIATAPEVLEFLKRYLRLTHCDLFFADAAIIVEGSVEKLLLPQMIEKVAKKLQSSYLTVLEIGGAYAHRFEGLLAFLHIPHLIITDLDSVSPNGRHPACRGDAVGALTSNASLRKFYNVNTIADLTALNAAQKERTNPSRFIAYQTSVAVEEDGTQVTMLPRTLEESFSYHNFTLLRANTIALGIAIPASLTDAYEDIFQRVGSSSFKKTDFAMSILATSEDWQVPEYITEGLRWLEVKLHPTPVVIEEQA